MGLASTTHKLTLEDKNGNIYIGRLDGTRIAESGDVEVYLASDDRVIAYDTGKLRFYAI